MGRPDAIDVQNKIVRELKPDSPTGRGLGAKQVNRYARALEKYYNDPPGSWTSVVDLYNRAP